MNRISAEDAIALIQSKERVFVHGGVATPQLLIQELVRQAERLRGVELIHLHVSGDAAYADKKYAKSFSVANLFVGGNMRGKLREGVDYLPCFLSEIPNLFRRRKRPLDVTLVQVSPPDRHGHCSLGTSVDAAVAAVNVADVVIAQVNPRMPRVLGDGVVHQNVFSAMVDGEAEIPEVPSAKLGEVERQIGKNIASIVEDGATLQMGIGAIPDAALAALCEHKHLGVHTEMFTDGILPLVEAGVIDNSNKKVHPGKMVTSFLMGTRKLYDFVDDNAAVIALDCGYVNAPHIIARNPKVTAINSAVEVDLTGQVCADSIGARIISGVGGQMDFIRGASLSDGGKPIIALPSRTKKGAPRIVPLLKHGAGVVTTRAHVHFVVTEYGIADLFGCTLRERKDALIRIAHPDDREVLDKAWHEELSHAPC
ncbi:MAG: 4-hydroxybutyrate CoA-transferase [Deltaproteobacteria bacterium]|nr:4-hydroxybutyrate CoA-transferase [Deltaproteobacteria bacterium]